MREKERAKKIKEWTVTEKTSATAGRVPSTSYYF